MVECFFTELVTSWTPLSAALSLLLKVELEWFDHSLELLIFQIHVATLEVLDQAFNESVKVIDFIFRRVK